MTATAQALPLDPVLAAQSTFRAIMNAMARPGTVCKIAGLSDAPPAMSPELAAVALALFDNDTPLWIDEGLAKGTGVIDWLRFQTGARLTSDHAEAAFALVADPDRLPPFSAFNLGTPEYPDRSTTVILQVKSFKKGPALTLSGPGVLGAKPFCASPVPDDLAERLIVNRGLFPRGIDLILVAEGSVAALPRSVRLAAGRS